jgi:hypothetical protein
VTTYAGLQGVGASARFQVSVDPGAIEAAGQRLTLLADHLGDVGSRLGTLFTSIDVGSWQGVTRDAMSAELGTLAGQVAGFPERFSDAGAALLALAEQARETLAVVGRANADWEASQNAYAGAERSAQQVYRFTTRDLELGADPATVAADRDRAARDRDAAIHRAASNRDITDGYTARAVDGAVAALQDEARRAAAALAGAVLPGTGTPSTVPACRAPLPPATIADLLGLEQTGRRFTEGWDDFDSPEQAEQAGREMGDRLRSLTGTGTDPQATARLQRYAVNPAFARGLYTELGPETMTSLPFYAALTLAPPGGLGLDPFGGDLDLREAAEAQAQTVPSGLARILVTLSHDPTVAPGLGGDLVRSATTQVGSAYGLTVLLSKADGMDRDVARSLATGLYDAERSSGQSPYWWYLSDVGAGIPRLAGSDKWYDAMVGVEELLARDPVLAQEFLLGPDGHGGDDGPHSRLAYLAGERTTRSDGGDALGRLVEAAATLGRDGGVEGASVGWRSAEVAAQLVSALTDGGQVAVPSAMRDSVAGVLAQYFDDVQAGIIAPTTEPGGAVVSRTTYAAGLSPWGITLSGETARGLVAAVTGDDDAFATLIAAEADALNRQIDAYLTQVAPGGFAADEIGNVARTNATTWAVILDSANLADIGEGAAADARRAQLIGLASSALGWVDLPGSGLTKDVIGLIVDQAKKAGAHALAGDAESRARAASADEWQLAQSVMVDSIVAAMYDHGLFAHGGQFADQAPPAGLQVREVFLSDGAPISWAEMSVAQQKAYVLWLTGSGSGLATHGVVDSVTGAFAAVPDPYRK